MFRYLVLGLLRSGQPQHGYALVKAYRKRSGILISNGNFYRELRCLVTEGLVRGTMNPEGADARRAPYEITADGSAEFDAWFAAPGGAGIGQYDDELSWRALFLGEADAPVARRMLERWREELWLRGKVLERERETANVRAGDGAFNALSMLLARRLKHIAADIEFLDELRLAYDEWLGGRKELRQPARNGVNVRQAPQRSGKVPPRRS